METQTAILDSNGVRIGSFPAYLHPNTYENRDVFIVGTKDYRTTPLSKSLLHGFIMQEPTAVACIIESGKEYSDGLDNANLCRLGVESVDNTKPSDTDIAYVMANNPRMVFHATMTQDGEIGSTVKDRLAAVLRQMESARRSGTHTILFIDGLREKTTAALCEMDAGYDGTVMATAKNINYSEETVESIGNSYIRIVVGRQQGWGEEELDAMRLSKDDLDGLDMCKALVAVGSDSTIVELA